MATNATTVKEKSPLHMTLVFTDELGAPLIPTTVEWHLQNIDADLEVVPWTFLASPAATMNMIISASNNAIVNEANNTEERIFSVRVDDGLSAEGHEEFQYQIINLCIPTGP